MLPVLIASFLGAMSMSLLIVVSGGRHAKWSADTDLSGPQKVHATAVVRIGGLAIAAGLLAGAGALVQQRVASWQMVGMLCLCGAPTLFAGLLEDLTKSVSPSVRLGAAALSGLLGALLVNAVLARSGWPAFDALIAIPAVALALTTFTVAGVVNSFNIIDGLNGLAAMVAGLAVAAIGWIGWHNGDELVVGLALATLGAIGGFLVWNFPRGLLFLGDSGAYVLGLAAVELGFVLLWRDRAVASLAPLTLFWYPVFETLFSMYRRKVMQRRAVSRPDGIHLHSLVYRRITRQAAGGSDGIGHARANSRASTLLWALALSAILPTLAWWDDNVMLALTMVACSALYMWLYWRIVHFRTPHWIRLLARRRATPFTPGSSASRET